MTSNDRVQATRELTKMGKTIVFSMDNNRMRIQILNENMIDEEMFLDRAIKGKTIINTAFDKLVEYEQQQST